LIRLARARFGDKSGNSHPPLLVNVLTQRQAGQLWLDYWRNVMAKKSAAFQVAESTINDQNTNPHPAEGDIAFRAHEIFVERGAAPGQDLDDWLQAERELMASSPVKTQRSQIAKTLAKPTSIR
jgi:hypothetical protein